MHDSEQGSLLVVVNRCQGVNGLRLAIRLRLTGGTIRRTTGPISTLFVSRCYCSSILRSSPCLGVVYAVLPPGHDVSVEGNRRERSWRTTPTGGLPGDGFSFRAVSGRRPLSEELFCIAH